QEACTRPGPGDQRILGDRRPVDQQVRAGAQLRARHADGFRRVGQGVKDTVPELRRCRRRLARGEFAFAAQNNSVGERSADVDTDGVACHWTAPLGMARAHGLYGPSSFTAYSVNSGSTSCCRSTLPAVRRPWSANQSWISARFFVSILPSGSTYV